MRQSSEADDLMDKRIKKLLRRLRKALPESSNIGDVIDELEQVGWCPAFAVDVAMRDARDLPTLQPVLWDGPLLLTADDAQFLQILGIQTPRLADAPGC